ncbi:MAG: DUF1631 domain-containing protein [Gammaproteobacteria bacterium]|nr:DUF1631 domain-containing protein [Gammaproteobacteria bacterium]
MAMNSPGPSRTGALPPRFKELMQGCRQMARSHLAPLFLTMLENADVALLEFAGKAESNAAQGKLFEAMQELKRKRPEVEQTFYKFVDVSFRDFISGTGGDEGGEAGAAGDINMNRLSLVEKHEVEAALPVQNMVAKANANYSEQLYGLNQRLAVVNGGSRLPDAALPGGPVSLSEAARSAFGLLDMDGKTRMVIYAVFERYVMRELTGLYDEYNRRLVNAGILPNLRYEIRKQHDPRQLKSGAPGAAPSPATPAEGGARQTVGEETFQSILELMARSRDLGGAGTSAAGAQASEGVVSEAVAASSRTTILGTLDSIQHEHSDSESNARFHHEIIENIGVDTALLEKLRTTLVEERQRLYGGIDRRKVASADADVIDLVGMLFEYMLQDEQLPNVAKALLSRLHTPFLKVAMLDRQLFTEKSHPGRRLLDKMAEAGARWVTEDDLERGIFPCMRAVVERILRDFKDDLSLFDELLSDFSAHLREVEQKAQVIERRSVEAADGQARLHNARARASDEVGAYLHRARLAPEAHTFMRQVWAEKLTFILLRERDADQTEAWALAVKLGWDLAWSMGQHAEQAERDRLHDALPKLRAELRAGLEALQGYGRHDSERMFAQICAWQDEALAKPESVPAPATPAVEPAPEPTVEAAVAPVLVAESLSDEMREMVDRLGGLEFDTWFEFAGTDTTHARRLKLAWYSKISSNYMFVDAMGVKAAEYSRTNLARMLCTGQARFLSMQNKPFLDRALETILTWLGRTKTETMA